MGRLFDIIDEHRDRQSPYEPSYSRIAEQVGVSRQTLLNWKAPTKLIDREHLLSLARVTGVPYQRVLDALLDDIGYLAPTNLDDRRLNREGGTESPVPKAARKTPPRERAEREHRKRQREELGEESQVDPDEDEGGA